MNEAFPPSRRRPLRYLAGLLCTFLAIAVGAVAAALGNTPVVDPPPLVAAVEDSTLQLDPFHIAADEADPLGKRFRDGLIISGSTPHRIILFTFDDGPDARNTPRLLSYLDAVGVKAVFFLTARRLLDNAPHHRRHREVARDIVRRGHMVASHTVTHTQLTSLSNASIIEELRGTEDVFKTLYGSRPWLMRPPGGARSERVDLVVANRRYTDVLWNLGTGDPQVRTAEEVLQTWRRVFARRETKHNDRGGIILLHDTHEWSVEAFLLIYDDLMARNCELLDDVGEELYDIVDDPAFFFVPRGQGSTSLIAPPAVPDPEILAERQAKLRVATEERCRPARRTR